MKDFVVHGYMVSPGDILVIGVYRPPRNASGRWYGEVASDHQGHPITLITNGGHQTAEDAFGWAKSELDRIESLRRAHYKGNKL